jgi:hypothetical protein
VSDSAIREKAKKYGYLLRKPRGDYCYELYDPLTDRVEYANTAGELEQLLPITWGPHHRIMAEARRQRLVSRMEEWEAAGKGSEFDEDAA